MAQGGTVRRGRPAARRMARGGAARGRGMQYGGGVRRMSNVNRNTSRMRRSVGRGYRRNMARGGSVGSHQRGNINYNCPGGGSTITGDCIQTQRKLSWT